MTEAGDVEAHIPRLSTAPYRITSPRDVRYNCFAWAAGDSGRLWSPSAFGGGVYWPPGIPALPNLAGVVAAYSEIGYTLCESGSVEPGVEKIAIFTDASGEPRHAARQLSSGWWVSKLGDHVDIEHEAVEAVGGSTYGEPTTFLQRPR